MPTDRRLLIRGGDVVTLDPALGTLPGGDMLVLGDRIAEVGVGLEVGDAEVVDARGTVVLPGFVDTHRHTWQTVLRGMLPSCSLGQYFGSVMVGVGPRFAAEDVEVGNLVGAWEALNAGVTTLVDWSHCTNTPEHADAAIGALRETGIRALFAYGWPGGPEYLMNSTLPHPRDAVRVRNEHFASEDGLLTFGLALRGPTSTPDEVTRADWALAHELDARITVHVGMRVPGAPGGAIGRLESLGLLGPKSTYVHCNETSDDELAAIAASGGTVSVSPYVEMVMGHGHPPTARLAAAGLAPTLSVDTCTTVPGDMFTQMRAALAQGRAASLADDPTAEFAPTIEALDVLRYATVNGAAACGLEDRVGSLTRGKQADVVMIRADAINTMPSDDPVATVVGCADTANVDSVWVAGRAVKRDGRLLDVDLRRLHERARASRSRVLAPAAS